MTRLFHYDTFKARMALPATHKDFPNVAVLHGICATAARYTARVFTCNPEDEPWLRASEQLEDPRREEDFGIRHSLYAWQAVNRQLCQGVHIYDCAQALMLLANHNHMYGRWVEGWISIGLAGRLMAPLGLNQRERAGGALGPSGRGDLLSPALNGIEREERRALFWTVFLYDVQVSASSGWGGSMQMDEIVSHGNSSVLRSPSDLASDQRSYHYRLVWKLSKRESIRMSLRTSRVFRAQICTHGTSQS